MSKKTAQERREYWLEKINAWQASGKSAFAWCRENNINNKAFYRWRTIFFNPKKPSLKLKPDSFIEIQNKKCCILEIEYKKYKFNLKDFSFSELNKFLKILKSL